MLLRLYVHLHLGTQTPKTQMSETSDPENSDLWDLRPRKVRPLRPQTLNIQTSGMSDPENADLSNPKTKM